MVYLVDEMFKQRNKRLRIVFGSPILPETFDERFTDWQWAEKLRLFVYRLSRDETAAFHPS
jgi:hypothetical protein